MGFFFFLQDYKNNLSSAGYTVADVNILNMKEINDLVFDISGKNLPLSDWYNASLNAEWSKDEADSYISIGDLKSYVSNGYSWIWNTTYWTRTLVGNDTKQEGVNNDTYFISSAGDICYADSCRTTIPRAGIRPVITMAADQFELNRMDIVGSVRWVDNNNSSKIRPNKSIIKLYRNGVMIDSVEVTKDEEEDLWRFSFKNLLKYDASGNLYKYTITQDDVAQYASDITNFDVVNEYAPSAKNPKTSAMNPGIYAGIIAILGIGMYPIMRKNRR